MSRPRVISVGSERHLYPKEYWGRRDYELEQEWIGSIGEPLTHAPGGPPPDLKFRLFDLPVIGGAFSRSVDELVARHTGRR